MSFLLALCCVPILLGGSLCAQLASSPPTSTGDTSPQATQEAKGLEFLRDAMRISQQLNEPANRIFIESAAAALLLPRDASLALSLMRDVEQDYRALVANPSSDPIRRNL